MKHKDEAQGTIRSRAVEFTAKEYRLEPIITLVEAFTHSELVRAADYLQDLGENGSMPTDRAIGYQLAAEYLRRIK